MRLLAHATRAALLASLLLAPAELALADSAPVKSEVLVILAKEAPGDVDARLKEMPALQKPPFNGFKSMKVLSTTGVELTEDKDATVALPNGGTLKLKLLERMPDGRHKVQVSIARPGKPDNVITVMASAEPFFVAGQSHEGGTLVIGVTVGGAKK
jgi:hypothetical protein